MAILVEVIIVLVTVVDILSWHLSDLKLRQYFTVVCANLYATTLHNYEINPQAHNCITINNLSASNTSLSFDIGA